MNKYYDGTKLLSLLDLNGNKPEIYMVTTNRTGGKTTYFSRLLVNRFLKHGEKFCLLYRYNYELDDIADKFFKDIGTLFFRGMKMCSKRRAHGIFHELQLNESACGYAVALNNSDQIKKYSHLFSDVKSIFFDEFQSETNHYCTDEIKKFISIHTSIARGQGKQTRRVPVYMCGNTVSIINPYYIALGITNRLHDDTIFLKGNGYVLEQGFVETASRPQNESAFNQAFINDKYVAYSNQGVYLNDSKAFIDRPKGKSKYVCSIVYKGKLFGLKEFTEQGIIYCDDNPDASYPVKIAVTTDDHNINYVMLKRNDFVIQNLRYLFERGYLRFKDGICKEAILTALSY